MLNLFIFPQNRSGTPYTRVNHKHESPPKTWARNSKKATLADDNSDKEKIKETHVVLLERYYHIDIYLRMQTFRSSFMSSVLLPNE